MPSSSMSTSSRQCCQKRYLCLWGLSALLPFIVFRLMLLDTRFQFPSSSPINFLSGYLEGLKPVSGTLPAQNDEDARSSPDDWINQDRSPGVGRGENNGPPHPLERIPIADKETTLEGSHPKPPPIEIFGLLENSETEKLLSWEEEEKTIEKEQLPSWEEEEKTIEEEQLLSWEEEEKTIQKEELLSWEEEEKTIHINVTAEQEKDSKASGKESDGERNAEDKKQGDQKSETENKEPTFGETHQALPPVVSFGLPEHNEKEQLLSRTEKEKTTHINVTTAEENDSKATDQEGEEERDAEDGKRQDDKKSETGDKEQAFEGSHPALPPVESFGLPEDNEKEQLRSWEEKEQMTYIDVTMAGENDSKATKEGEDERNADYKKMEDYQKSDGEQRGAEENNQADELVNQLEKKEKEGTKQYEDASLSGWNVTIPNSDMGEATPAAVECDLFDGSWVWDSEGPLYTNVTCPYVHDLWNCMKNGRPDTEYLYLKWSPWACDLPRFDAKSFLNSLTGKSIAFVGDSLGSSQCVSLICILSQVEEPIQTDSSKHKSFRWYFEEHRVTLEFVWSPFLLKEEREGTMGFEKGQSVLYLDVLDNAWTSVMDQFDILVFSTGAWYVEGSVFVKEDKIIGCHTCPGLNLQEIGFYEPYREAVRLFLDKVATKFKGVAVVSATILAHFENGTWQDGGECRREKPLAKGEEDLVIGSHVFNGMRDILMSEFNSIANDTSNLNEDLHLEFLDVTTVLMTRVDGHPGPYRSLNPYEGRNPNEWIQNDCVHSCLPGPVDTSNQLLGKLLEKYL